MQVLIALTALAATVSSSHAAGSSFEQAFSELSGCHSHFGLCVFKGGIAPLNETACTSLSLTFKKLVESADDLQTKSAQAALTSKSIYMTRIKDGVTAEALMAQATVESLLFCQSGSYAFVQGTSPSQLIDFQLVVPSSLKLHALYYIDRTTLPKSENNFHTVRLTRNSRGRSVEVANRWATSDTSRRTLSGSNVTVTAARNSEGEELNALVVSSASHEDLESLAEMPETVFISPRPSNKIFNFAAAQVTQEGFLGPYTPLFAGDDFLSDPGGLQLHQNGITGKGQIVGVGDSGLDLGSCFFRDKNANETAHLESRKAINTTTSGPKEFNYPNHRKVVQYYVFADGEDGQIAGHGTHVSGTVAGLPDSLDLKADLNGQALDSSAFKGMAPEAKIAFFDMGMKSEAVSLSVPDLLSDVVRPSFKIGARIHTNSWGGTLSAYTPESSELDDYLFDNQDLLVLFAAGNEGPFTLSAQSQTKNVLSVGATISSSRSFGFIRKYFNNPTFSCGVRNTGVNCGESMTNFSSTGPTFDGRIKPDVVAPGYLLFSALSTSDSSEQCGIVYKAGTSMATPVVAGNCALVRQFFVDGYYPSGSPVEADKFVPMGALIKAVLIDGATLMKGEYFTKPLHDVPNVVQGFGRIFLRNTLLLGGSWQNNSRNVFIDGDMANMPVITRQRVEKKYIFDVDVQEPLKATLVWYDRGAPEMALKALVNDLDLKILGPNGEVFYPNGLSKEDPLNTVEKIEIGTSALVKGRYEVLVSGKKLNLDRQPYALVVSGDLASAPTLAPTGTPISPSTPTPSSSTDQNGTTIAGLTKDQVILYGAVAGGAILAIVALCVGIKCMRSRHSANSPSNNIAVSGNHF